MRIRTWACPLLLLGLAASPTSAQILHYIGETREVYAFASLTCDVEQESRAVPAASFAQFDSTVTAELSGCGAYANSGGIQTSTLLGDVIDIDEIVWVSLANSGFRSAIGRSDASITFHLEEGHWYAYHLDVSCQSNSDYGGGIATASFALDLLGSSGGSVERFVAQTDTVRTRSDQVRGTNHRGILQAGDYAIEARASADATTWTDLFCSVQLELRFYVIPTAVEASSWGRVKSFYQ